ncbi:MAG: Selenocysteine lyase [candidate division CPR3 bacterium GW2011_GWE2_35_7]|nr:MAG: Selenocysteine lyase [candidate division CPR3 bacterium GW2011_GWE2_35_7]
MYPISQKATEEHEATREIVTKFIGAKHPEEVIFTKNTSESLNLLMYTLGDKIVQKDDNVIISIAEHHSNFVPWQMLCLKKEAEFRVLGINKEGTVKLDELEQQVDSRTKIIALTYISNVLGTVNPIEKIVKIAKKKNPNVIIIIDAAQAAPHLKLEVRKLGADFVAFSSHKMLGPTGVGILWGKKELFEEMPPFMFGGEMIEKVSVEKTTFDKLPHKFEAGTPAIGEIIALKEAVKYLEKIGLKNIEKHEKELTNYALERLNNEFGNDFQVIGPNDYKLKTGIIAFVFKDYHPHDIADILGNQGICIRAGHHCAAPLHEKANISASSRMSFYLYNNQEDVEKIINGLKKVDQILKMGFHERSTNSKFKQPCC